MSIAGPEDLVRRLLAAWDARDFDAFTACLTADVEWYDPAMPSPPVRGRAAVGGFAESVLRAFPDFRYDVLPPICVSADGSRCAVKWRISGTHTGRLEPLGYAPTRRRACFEGVDIFEIERGQVRSILTAFDLLLAAEQLLGMTLRPTPGSWRAWLAVGTQRTLAWVARARG